MKHRLFSIFFLSTLLFAVPWKVIASSTTHYMGTITIYVDEEKTFYRNYSYIPSAYYVNADSWFLRQKNGNSWIDNQEFYDVKISSKSSESCTIVGLASNNDPYGLSTTELHCKGTRQSIGEYEEMVWTIVVKSYGYLRVNASPAGGTVSKGTTVTLTAKSNGSTVSGCDIYYTLDGTVPTKNSIKYTSSGVTINKSGWLTAKAYKTGYESISYDEWYFTIKNVLVTNISLDNTSLSLEPNQTKQLTATVKPDNATDKSVTWTSNNTSVAIVSSSGLVEAKAAGSATITCKANDGSGKQATCSVIVKQVVAEINATNFPDETFRNYLLSQNYGKDGKLTEDEINNITRIDVSGTSNSPGSISLLKGIEYFSALTYLSCQYNQLTSLDVSKNTALEYLNCSYNQLASLDVSKNTALEYLNCGHNQLASLDVSKNTALTRLYCHNNQLTSLDVSKNTALTDLGCLGNQLTVLDVSKNTALTILQCCSNQLTSLDVSKNTALTDLWCRKNRLTSLDVSKNTTLTWLSCWGNQLTSLDVSNTALTYLSCARNKISGANMDNLISSLPQNATEKVYSFYVINNSEGDEGNVCTVSQVAAAKAKGWTPLYNNITNGEREEYEGSDEEPALKGDVNMDNAVNGTDLVALSNIILGRKEQTASADVNGDGSVNGTDIVALSNIILGRSNAPRRAPSTSAYLSVDESFDIKAGEEKDLLINLTNPQDEITLVQFDLHLPAGLSIKKNGNDLDFDIAGRTTWRKHTLDASEVSGAYRFLLYSSSNALIEGTSGAIIKVTLVADNTFNGGKIVIDNALLVSPDEKETKPEAYEYTIGGGETPDDGSAKLAVEPFDIKAGEEKEMLIDLTNPQDEITLVQFDLHLPEGLSIKKNGNDLDFDIAGRTTWRKHTLDASEVSGAYRFLLYSSSNALIEGTSGAIIKITVVADNTFNGGKIVIDNALLVSPDEKETKPTAYEYTIGDDTGISTVTVDRAANAPIYNLRGQRLTAPQKGVNIIGGKKVVVK